MSNSSLQVPPVMRVLASLTCTTIAVVGLTMYGVVSYVVIKHWKEIKNPFYNIVCHLAISDIGFSFIFAILMGPLILSPTSPYPQIVAFILPHTHELFAVCVFLLGFTLTFERSAIFLWPRMHAELFEYGRVHYTMATTWLAAILITVHPVIFGCYSYFDFGFYIQCTHPERMVHLIPTMLVSTLASVMMVMYLSVFVYLKKNKNNKVAATTEEARQQRSRARAERKLLVQGFIICLVLQVMALSFWFAPTDQAWGRLVLNLLCCINSACNPTIYITFNKTIRAKVALLLGIKQPCPVSSVKATTRTRRAGAQAEDRV